MATGSSASAGVIPDLMRSLAVGASPWKFSAKVVATSNVALAGLQTIDGESVDENDRVLTVAQTDTTKNTLWIAHAGPWELALDADQDSEITAGMTVYIVRGSSAKSFWTLVTPNNPIRLGITPLSWEKRIPDTLVLLNTATVDPAPDTLLKRGPLGEGKVTSLEISSGGEVRANIGGDEVAIATVDGSKNMQIGDAVETESILTIAGTSKNISTVVSGTGTALIAAIGASSKVSLSSSSVEVLRAVGGMLTSPQYASMNGAPASVGLFAAANEDSAILTVRNSGDTGDISVASVSGNLLRIGGNSSSLALLTSNGGTISLTVDATQVFAATETDTTTSVPARIIKQLNLQWKEIAYAATVTPNLADGMIQYIKLTGNVGINAPSEFGGTPGVTEQGLYVFVIEQDATGNRLADWGNGSAEFYQFVTDTGTLSTAGSALDVFVFLALPTKSNIPTMLCLFAKKGFTTDN